MSNQKRFLLTSVRTSPYQYPWGKLKQIVMQREIEEFRRITSKENVFKGVKCGQDN